MEEPVPDFGEDELRSDGGVPVLPDTGPPVREGQVFLERILVQVPCEHRIVFGRHPDRELETGEVDHVTGQRSSQSTVRMCAHRSRGVGRWS